ncbi:MAG TPA: MEMAR_RS02690 family S-layer glycoprotein [Methanocorpusculum sp.]|nr:MEMAR_RS02690 family S-layer glycoprotein [Methanocorpusculum sp.]HJK79713.1 MEMAR_RS02690 family S-layer glycoprotein [Methanocorpusculum sp.]
MKIIAVLAILLVAALFIGGASAQNPIDVNKTAVNAPSIGAGTYQLMNGTVPLDAGIVFTGADGATITTGTEGALTGIITIGGTTVAQLYNNTTFQYNFTVIPTPGITVDIPTGQVETSVDVNVTGSYLGSFAGKNITVDFGDGTEEKFSLTDSPTTTVPIDIGHQYTSPGTYTITVTTDAEGYGPWSGSVTVIPTTKKVDVNTPHGTAFVYQTVNVTDGASSVDTLYFYSSDSTPTLIATLKADPITGYFNLLEAAVNGHYGAWYSEPYASSLSDKYITIWYPDIALKAELTTGTAGATSGDSVDGKTFNKNTEVSFLIEAPNVGPADISTVKIVFTTPAGGKTTQFGTYEVAGATQYADFKSIDLETVQTIALGTGVIAGNDATAGVWTAQAEFTSPKGFADNAKKTNTISFTLQSTTLTITAAKDSVVRSNPFTVTIQGDSQKEYQVFIENPVVTDVNPGLQANQSGWQYDTAYDNFDNPTGAVFKTDATGKRTIQYNTAANTEDKTYTIRVESVSDPSDYDKVKVKVEKGAVTIAASGDGSYYIGEEIKLTGTNTDSSNIFLFITGPNLDYNDGIVLKDLGGSTGVQNAAYTAANPVAVKTDNTWEYKWDTTLVSLDAGAYTVYATSRLTNGKSSGAQNLGKVSGPASTWLNTKADVYGNEVDGSYYAVKLSDSEYATTSINLKKPFLSAVPSGTIVAKGDKIYIRGTAEGDPSSLQLYIFGPNFFSTESITVEDDGSYEKKIEVGSTWASNQYYVVIEHPMENGKLDVHDTGAGTNPRSLYIDNVDGITQGQQSSFVVEGTGKLQSANAANALTTMIDSANIDDIYTKLTFTVAEPVISVTNPGDKAVGTKFTISGTTNLAIDDQILVEVVSSSFDAVDKSQSSSTSGVSQTAKVTAGEGADNVWSVEVDTTNWKLDEYTIKVSGIEVDVTTTTNFNIVEKVDTPTPTPTATGATPTTTTAPATTTPTQTPGFGAFIALAGLGAVALLVLRRN